MSRTAGSSSNGQAVPSNVALRAWTLLDEMVLEVHMVSARFPEEERLGLGRALREEALEAAVCLMRGSAAGETGLREAAPRALACLAPIRYRFYLARRLNLIDLRRYRMLCLRHERVSSALKELARAPACGGSTGPGSSPPPA